MIPATDHGGRHAEIVSHGLNRVPFTNLVSGCAPRIARNLVGRMFARRNRDDEVALDLKILNPVEVIRLNDSLTAGVKSAGDRTQGITGGNFVITPPHPHVWWNRGNCG